MIYLHKILPLLVSPLFLVLALVVLGALRRRWRWIWVAATCLCAAALPVTSKFFMNEIEGDLVRLAAHEMPQADAVVVLSGMLHGVAGTQGVAMEWTDPDRFFGGVELHKAGRAKLLVFTGGTLPWLAGSPPEGAVLRTYAEGFGVPASDILVTGDVQNTRAEATAVRKVLGPNAKSILLVTSAFHMQRATRMFERAGFVVHRYPVDFRAGVAALTPMDFLPSGAALAGTELAMREFLGRAYYQLVRD